MAGVQRRRVGCGIARCLTTVHVACVCMCVCVCVCCMYLVMYVIFVWLLFICEFLCVRLFCVFVHVCNVCTYVCTYALYTSMYMFACNCIWLHLAEDVVKLSVFPDLVNGLSQLISWNIWKIGTISQDPIGGVIARCNSFITDRINNFYNLAIVMLKIYN